MLPFLVFIPAAAGLLVLLLPANQPRLIRLVALVATVIDLAVAVALWAGFDPNAAEVQFAVRQPWIPALNIQFFLGVDGLSLPLVFLTAFLSVLAVLVSWHIEYRARLYFFCLLVLETGVLGVFTALDFALFFLFWEVELLPMFLLIGIWGSPPPLGRREYSAMKFLVYTLFGSAFMLAGLLAVYFTGGTFDLIQLRQADLTRGLIPATLMFWFIFLSFAVKLPVFPFHTWLPDAHTDAPTAASVVLAGILLKMGGYGMIRICISLFPQVAAAWAPVLALLAVINVLYGALITLRQRDLKRLIAYSSVSHMGYVLLGIAALREVGMTGAVLQMFTHGTITGLLFATVGLVYDKTHTRQIPELQGLAHRMPFVATIFLIASLAALGLPTMSGFVAEFLVFVGSYPAFGAYTVLGVFGVVLAAGYMLWTVERSFFRTLAHRLHQVEDATTVERIPLIAFVAAIMVIGLWPAVLTDIIKTGLAPILGRIG